METNEALSLKINQMVQIIDQYRINIYNLELRINLMNKLLEEKGILMTGEFDKRWPIYLKNDIGILGPDGVMEGSLRVTFYENNRN